MSRGGDERVICPFFVIEPTCGEMSKQRKAAHEALVKKRIRCEGITPGGKIYAEFRNPDEKKEHMENFCESKCYEGCPVAQMLLAQYGMKPYKITQKGKV